jgi:o-succinylbenzoate---CoA ligase
MLVEAWLQRAASSAPDALAIQTPTESCTYAELCARARAGAQALAARGASPGERVAIALPAGLDFACALHACLLLGAAAVPVDLRLREHERRTIEDSAALVLDEPLGVSGNAPAPPVTVPAGTLHDLDAVAAVIHTSGTTSAPKPVELTYGNFLWSALGSATALGLDPAERWLCALPLAHVGGLSILLRSAIYATTAVVHQRFETEAVLDALRGGPGEAASGGPAERASDGLVAAASGGRGSRDPKLGAPVTLVSLVATTLARLLDAGLRDPPALRCALTGGGPVPAVLLERARAAGVPVSLTYGLTEACSQVTTTPLAAIAAQPDAQGQRGTSVLGETVAPSAGPSLFCTRVRTGTDGEIEIAGPTVARGAAGADGWLCTGDLGRLNAEGSLEVTGRKADTIVSGGENVAPTEVEAVLEAHPAVLEAAVLARPDERWGEAVAALVVVRAGAAVSEEQLRGHCAERLAPYKVPKQVVLVAGPLPRTRSGKLLRRELS